MSRFFKKLGYLFFPFSWYKLVAMIGLAIRVFVLPNPFEMLDIYLNLPTFVWRIILFIADYFIITPFLYWLIFGMVGLIYESGSNPVWGSFMYTVLYSSVVGMIYLMIIYGAYKFVLIVVPICFVLIYVILFILSWKVIKTTPF